MAALAGEEGVVGDKHSHVSRGANGKHRERVFHVSRSEHIGERHCFSEIRTD